MVHNVIQFFTQIICFYCREHERQSHIGLESSKLDLTASELLQDEIILSVSAISDNAE